MREAAVSISITGPLSVHLSFIYLCARRGSKRERALRAFASRLRPQGSLMSIDDIEKKKKKHAIAKKK